MRISLDSLGYDVNKPGGEIVEINFSIWDNDYLFEGNPAAVNSARAWWQSPWGNANADNVGRVHIRADVTANSGAVPVVAPDVIIKNGASLPAPIIDGLLNDAIWAVTDSFDVRWDDNALRDTYPGVGPYRSGQFQPELGGNPRPPVLDPGDATIKWFFRDDYLYLAAHVRDQLVQGKTNLDEWDGVRFMIGDREEVDLDFRMLFQQVTVIFDTSGNAIANEYLPTMVDSSDTEWGVSLKGNTTVNVHTDIDEGFIIELKVDLTYLGYPSGLGDKLLFMGVMLTDGDSFDDPLNNYGTRTWWFREHNNGPATAWMVMDPNVSVGIEDEQLTTIPKAIEVFGNFPNPFNPRTTIKYAIHKTGEVTLEIFNILGQEITQVVAGRKHAGYHELSFEANSLSSGLYMYRIKLNNETSNVKKMLLIK
jgi:hypothetical protein